MSKKAKKTPAKTSKKASKKPVTLAKSAKSAASRQASPVRSLPGIRLAPLHDRVVLKPVTHESAKQTDSGIFIPESVNEDKSTKRGTVVAIGEGRYDDGVLVPMSVNVGDTVLYQWGDSIKVDGVEYVIVRESEITAIIN